MSSLNVGDVVSAVAPTHRLYTVDDRGQRAFVFHVSLCMDEELTGLGDNPIRTMCMRKLKCVRRHAVATTKKRSLTVFSLQ